ncbi:aspartate carbamoyltransferase catalytic subunit [Sulfurovum sp. NBC37-1]|uniref:Aspartate carbamoyltransferase catalytic subunit n=1 Tax=Sulfurovum sp. (strain NBC37-1) TaxID=387093 RepID=PYRB_SULNB|nr:aspartate carbamoyltransferase catalytic subunit [Sulfurovum sp. NBC37-1]A6QC00.1 RecName: Full=Aspartate carbamoyltransferase catalytic subunit; AltName: Full=Aspartate transcarbamylase; Short=ATCase [Sulfurovum sp. NBC37-1]BAF73009.1 aspartate carbamoyltransferase, catalytic subunit [Sulfurovum sp. NBC37-1]
MQHLVDTSNFSDAQIVQLLHDAKTFKAQRPPQLLRDKLIITLFFEASTRTRSSFEVAAKRLGAAVVHLDPSRSSTKKGESLEDTFANLCAMDPDGVIIRHEENEAPGILADMQMTSVINAGAGNYAHPTQALLDLFTLMEHFEGNIEGKTIAIVGDIISSRVASSGIRLLRRMGMNVILVAPEPFMPQSDLPQYENLEDVLDKVDVIMSLRAQLERHASPIFDDYNEYARHYCITEERLGDRNILILHPGPVMRNIDISDEILEDPRCKVLTQVKNGVYMRMAILKLLLLDSNN